MAIVRVPGTDVWLDPNAITRVDITSVAEDEVHLRFSFLGDKNHKLYALAAMSQAKAFYESVWSLRASDDEAVVRIGNFG